MLRPYPFPQDRSLKIQSAIAFTTSGMIGAVGLWYSCICPESVLSDVCFST